MVAAAAGWYPDPAAPRQSERYFDGESWSPRVRPVTGAVHDERPEREDRRVVISTSSYDPRHTPMPRLVTPIGVGAEGVKLSSEELSRVSRTRLVRIGGVAAAMVVLATVSLVLVLVRSSGNVGSVEDVNLTPQPVATTTP